MSELRPDQRAQFNKLRAKLIEAAASTSEETSMSPDVVTVDASVDCGNATTIAIVQPTTGGRPVTIKMPSAATFDLFLPASLQPDDHIFTTKAGTPLCAVGLAALRYTQGEAISARGSQDRYGAFQARFIDAALCAATKASTIVVRTLNVTVPAKFADTETIDRMKRELRGRREHHYRGRPVAIEVRSVKIWREGEAALAALRGQMPGVGILIEAGGGQIHVVFARDGVMLRDPITRETGLQRSLDRAEAEIYALHGRRLTPMERYDVERAVAGGKPYGITINGKNVRIDQTIRMHLADVAQMVIADLASFMPRWRSADTIMLAGGQAIVLAEQYQKAIPGLKIPTRPDELNALGALLLGGSSVAVVEEEAA